tara:strand:+ start:273 stop:809 length:537 start_codon:yes stop_codon:yes gene_type:complete
MFLTLFLATLAAPAELDASLDQKLDVAFRACTLFLLKENYFDAANTELKDNGIIVGNVPPEAVVFTPDSWGPAATANVKTSVGWVSLSGFRKVNVCRVAAGGSADFSSARKKFVEPFETSSLWKAKPKQREGIVLFENFVLENAKAPIDTLLALSGPESTVNGGNGLQLMMTVSLAKR